MVDVPRYCIKLDQTNRELPLYNNNTVESRPECDHNKTREEDEAGVLPHKTLHLSCLVEQAAP